MKSGCIKLFSLLIVIFFVNILEFRNITKENKKISNSNKSENDYFRLLKNEYDTSSRTNDDKESIEKCQDIDEDYFLLPNISTIYDLSILNNKKIQIPQYLKDKGFSFSEGDIIKITNNQITHKSSTEPSSSGSPLFIKYL